MDGGIERDDEKGNMRVVLSVAQSFLVSFNSEACRSLSCQYVYLYNIISQSPFSVDPAGRGPAKIALLVHAAGSTENCDCEINML